MFSRRRGDAKDSNETRQVSSRSSGILYDGNGQRLPDVFEGGKDQGSNSQQGAKERTVGIQPPSDSQRNDLAAPTRRRPKPLQLDRRPQHGKSANGIVLVTSRQHGSISKF
jgi:hypothetical protein